MAKLKLDYLPAFLVKEPKNLNSEFMKSSISIQDNGIWLTVGKAAQVLAPESSRAFGGTFKQPAFRRLARAAIANTLGEGHHKVSLAFSVSQQNYDNFVDEKNDLSSEQKSYIEGALREIEFKEHPLGEVKRCSVEFTNITIQYETQAVLQAISDELKSFVLWQLGHGDLQQITLYDGAPIPTTHKRVEGLAAAIREFASYTNLPLADAIIAWQTGQKSMSDQMDGSMDEVFHEKRRAIREYFATTTQDLLNVNEPYKQRSVAIVLSGGGAKDPMIVDCLREEIESGGHYKLFTIDDLPINSETCSDPLYTCVNGLLKTSDLALDIGNSSLKTGYLS